VKEATASDPLERVAGVVRARVIELVDNRGNVCMRLCAGQDGPVLTIPADPTVCRGDLTASLRVVTGGSYSDALRPIAERVGDLEEVLTRFGAVVQDWRGGTILADLVPGWARRELELEAEVAMRGDGPR